MIIEITIAFIGLIFLIYIFIKAKKEIKEIENTQKKFSDAMNKYFN